MFPDGFSFEGIGIHLTGALIIMLDVDLQNSSQNI